MRTESKVFLAVIGAIVLLALVFGATQIAAPAAPAGPARVIASFSGDGSDETAQFTVRGDWNLAWQYDCSALGQAGNFVVSTDDGEQLLNELSTGGSGTVPASDDGVRFLRVVTECSWSVNVVGAP